MNAAAPLQADRREIDRFVAALFRYADGGTFVSLRSFHDGGQKVFAIEAHALTGDLDALIDAALNQASRAARAGSPVVFAPPIATFGNSSSATEADLCNGLALSVECDRAPTAARTKLESLIGPATVIVASGGEWLNPDTGEYEPKLHLHWRLSEPTRDQAEHAALKTARSLAMEIVGADPTSKPTVHPLRWPGSWHRKAQPRLARIVAEADAELDLDEALERLREARAVVRPTGAGASAPLTDSGHGESRETAELIAAILSGSDYHAPLVALAMRYLKAGMPDGQAVQTLRGFMLAVPERLRDLKDGTVQPGRWQARFDDIWRTVSTARAKLGEANAVAKDGGSQETQSAEWPDPVDFLASDEATGAPVLHSDHVPDALAPFILDVAERMGVDPAMVALGALVALATVIHDDFRLQPKRHDDEWTESPRIWGAIVGDPSVRKSPVVAAVTRPLAALEAQFHTVWDQAMRQYKIDHARWKKEKDADPAAEPVRPLRERVMIEDTTTEAISEVLRTDSEATMRAPAGKVLVRQDELSEFLANLDRYRASGGGGDRGAYLRLYNGGAFSVDRVKRGTLTIPNWSATFLGGIQPEPIQRIAKEAADDGLLQRFMYVVPGPSVAGVDRRPDAAARARYEALFGHLVRMRRTAGVPEPRLVLHSDAHVHRESIDELAELMKAMPDTSPKLKSALGKWPGLFARLVVVFHLIDVADAELRGQMGLAGRYQVPAATAARVAAYMRQVLLPHLLRADAVMYLTPQTGHARWIAGHILAHELKRVTKRDVVRSYGPLKPTERQAEIASVMESLVTMGWLAPEPSANAAKPPTAWQVNPKVQVLFAERAKREKERRDEAQRATAEAIRRSRTE